MSDQQKKTVIVTGGTRGIGFAIVKTLLEKGYDVVYTGQSARSVAEASAKFAELKLPAPHGRALDLRDEGMIEEFGRSMFGCYGLVNCAGVCMTSRIDGESWQKVWSNVLRTNLDGTAMLTHLMERALCTPGRIVNISSQLGEVGRAGYTAYCASKFGLIGFTKALSCELAERGITVNAVCPGWIQTEMSLADLERAAKDQGVTLSSLQDAITSKLDQRRFNTPEEVANIVAFFLSPEASGVTGRCMEMGGPSA